MLATAGRVSTGSDISLGVECSESRSSLVEGNQRTAVH